MVICYSFVILAGVAFLMIIIKFNTVKLTLCADIVYMRSVCMRDL
jgi:hypothetical protein